MKSRLTRRSEKQTKNQLYVSIAGIIIALIVLFQLGPIVLTQTGTILDSILGKNKEQINYLSDAPYQAPILDPLPTATPSSTLIISGKTIYKDGIVEIYVNNDIEKEIEVSSDGEFEDEIRISKGNNSIKARYTKEDKQSNFTEEFNVSYLTDAPKLEVSSPQDGQTFTAGDQNITISGTTDADATVTVNSRVAIVGGDGAFTYNLGLSDGENKIIIESSNQADKKTSKTITVTFKP